MSTLISSGTNNIRYNSELSHSASAAVSGGKALGTNKQALSKTIRAHLPSIELLNEPGWAFGSAEKPQANPQATEVHVQLKNLSWRQIDVIDWQRRACATGIFSGQAWIQGRLVDFAGDNVRDLATGGFMEFQLMTMGL
jgi:hypothetical protein